MSLFDDIRVVLAILYCNVKQSIDAIWSRYTVDIDRNIA